MRTVRSVLGGLASAATVALPGSAGTSPPALPTTAASGSVAAMACPRPATTTIDIEACQARTLLALGRTYNVEISALWSIVDPAGRALTRRAHERWLAYRDDTCRLRARAYEGGTLAPVAFGACAIEITRARIGELRRALEIQCRGHSRTGARKRCPHG